MKKFLLLAILSVGGFAQAASDIFGPITEIKADMRCENKIGKGLAIALPKGGHQGRVWISKAGDNKGLELTVTDFKVARCLGCFKFSATLMGQEVFGEANDSEIVYSGKDSNGQVKEMLRTKCVPVQSQSAGLQSAFLKVCPASIVRVGHDTRMMPAPGCLNKIVVGGQELVVTSGNAQAEKILNNIIGTHQFHHLTKSTAFKVEGHQDKMVLMGYERQVFVVTKIDEKSVVLPK